MQEGLSDGADLIDCLEGAIAEVAIPQQNWEIMGCGYTTHVGSVKILSLNDGSRIWAFGNVGGFFFRTVPGDGFVRDRDCSHCGRAVTMGAMNRESDRIEEPR